LLSYFFFSITVHTVIPVLHDETFTGGSAQMNTMKIMLVSIESFQKGSVPAEVSRFIDAVGEPFIVLDESSKIKSNMARKQAKQSKRSQSILLLNEVGHRCIMTGTFMSKSPMNAYNQMEFLKESFFGMTQWSFEGKYTIKVNLPRQNRRILITPEIYQKIYNEMHRSRARGREQVQATMTRLSEFWGVSNDKLLHIARHKEYTPFLNVDDLWKRVSTCCMVVRKKDVTDVPPRVYEKLNVAPTHEMKALYDDLLNVGFITVDGQLVAYNGVSIYHRFQDICNGYIPVPEGDDVVLRCQKSNPKIEALLSKLDDIDLDEHQVVIFSNRRMLLEDTCQTLREAGIETVLYDGSVSQDDKEQALKRFAEGSARVFACNQKSAAFGLDDLKRASYAFFISSDCSVEVRDQAESRIDRGVVAEGTKTIIDIVVDGSIDEAVIDNLLVGKELLNTAQTSRDIFEWRKNA
jgi:hypothetical protein